MLQQRGVLLWGGLLLLLLGLLIAFWPSQTERATPQRLAVVEGCMLHQQACSVDLPGGGTLTFEMNPRPLPTTEPIALKAHFTGAGVERMEVLFEGKDMYMGYLQYRMRPEADGMTYRGEGSLSVCIRRLMEWFAVVRVQRRGEWVEIPFPFETIHP